MYNVLMHVAQYVTHDVPLWQWSKRVVFIWYTTLLCPPPGITWVLVYRTEKYKRLKAEVEKQSKKRKWLTCERHTVISPL